MDAACLPTPDESVKAFVDEAPPLSIRQQEHLKLIFASAIREAQQKEAA